MGGGIFRSSNNGDTWSAVNFGLPFLDCNNINVVNNGILFTVLDDYSNHLFRSTDNGESWNQVGNGLENQPVLSVDADSAGNLFAATSEGGVFKSSDLGENWLSLNYGIGYTLARTIKVDKNSTIYLGTNGEGVMKSEDSGGSWNQTNTGILNSSVRDFALTNMGILYAATSGGVFSTSDLGNQWKPLLEGLEDREIRSIASNSTGKIFAGSWYDGLYILDENNIWNNVIDLAGKSIRTISIDENDWVYAGSYGISGSGIFRSTDDGESWIQVNSELHTLKIHTLGNGLLFASSSSGLYKSTDYGQSWSYCGFSDLGINGITSDSLQNIFVLTGSSQGAFMSTDLGATWNSIGMGGSGLHSISYSREGYIYVGTDWGVYRTNDLGVNWELLLDGMSNYYASALISNLGYKVFVGTLGGGVCVGPDSLTSVIVDKNNPPNFFNLSQNYPNPFNPNTVISWQSTVGSHQTLKIYDVLGNEVVTLVDEYKPAGKYEVEFSAKGGDAYNLPSGVYFYQLQSGYFISTKSMVLIK